MSIWTLDTNFSKFSHGDFIYKMMVAADKLEVHPVFKEFPEHVPGPVRLREIAERLMSARDAARNSDELKVAELKAVRTEAETAMNVTAHHLVMISIHLKDPDVLLNTGFDSKPPRTYKRLSSKVPAPLSKFEVKNGPVSGTVIVTVNGVIGTGGIELQVMEIYPVQDSSWKTVGVFFLCRFEFNLEPVKKYNFRARYHNAGGASEWTPIVSLTVG